MMRRSVPQLTGSATSSSNASDFGGGSTPAKRDGDATPRVFRQMTRQ